MAIGRPGADSSNLVTRLIGGKPMVDVAAELLGQMPVLWGRYFTSVATSGLVEYRARRENQALRDRNIRVLPIARQTKHVDGTQADGSADAQLNAEDLIKTFGVSYLQSQGGRFIMFLDVEGTPSLSTDYYLGWARTLVRGPGLRAGAYAAAACHSSGTRISFCRESRSRAKFCFGNMLTSVMVVTGLTLTKPIRISTLRESSLNVSCRRTRLSRECDDPVHSADRFLSDLEPR